MSIGSLGPILPGAAGAPLAQTRGAESQRAQQLADTQQRTNELAQHAEDAAGIAQTDGEEHEAEERDGDGRRLWEKSPQAKTNGDDAADEATPSRLVKDPSGDSGSQLDLSG